MKRYVLSIVLMTMFVSTAAFAQEPEPEEDVEREMHLQSMRLELEEREAELRFQERMRELELEHHRKGKPHLLLIVLFIVHILMAVWVYKDIRERNRGSGIWIVIALLTGLFGVLAYAVVRLGDIRQTK